MEICCQLWVSVRVPAVTCHVLFSLLNPQGLTETSAHWDSSQTLSSCTALVRAFLRGGMRMARGTWCHLPVPLTLSSPCSPDVDECTEGSHACRYNQICQNAAGSYRCSCPPGYRTLGTGWPCLGTSWALTVTPLRCSSLSFPHPAAAPHFFPPPDINECLHFPPPCAFECRNLRGSYECLCPAGKTLLPGGQCGMEGGDTTSSVPQNTPLRWQGPSSRPRGRSFYTQLALRRVAKAAGMGARSPPCPMGYSRRNGTCTGECAPGKGVGGSSETTLSPKNTSCPSCCPVHHFEWSLLCWEGT